MTIDRELERALRHVRQADRHAATQPLRKRLWPESYARREAQRAERERVTGNREVRR